MTHHKDREYEAEAIIIVNALAEEKDPVRFVGKVLTEAHRQGRVEVQIEAEDLIQKRVEQWADGRLTDEFQNGRFWEAKEIQSLLATLNKMKE